MKAKHFIATLFATTIFLVASTTMAKDFTAHPVALKTQQHVDAFDSRHDEFTGLLNWAAYISGYQSNGINPQLQFRAHQFFVDNACGGNEKCRVIGWYNDQNIVYIDDRLEAVETLFERSLVVHEFVHYLQHISGNFETGTCEGFVQREREAYAAQREFIMAYGSMPTMNVHQHSCVFMQSQDAALAATQ